MKPRVKVIQGRCNKIPDFEKRVEAVITDVKAITAGPPRVEWLADNGDLYCIVEWTEHQ